ncbi:MAG: cyclopropane-fatty-acyl-phospholipid synthase family protein, partial [Pigmentiphaga sp.]
MDANLEIRPEVAPSAGGYGQTFLRAAGEQILGIRSLAGNMALRGLFGRLIRTGTLILNTPDGTSLTFGEGTPSVAIRIEDWATVWRLLLHPDLATGEAYVDGTLAIETGNIYDFLALCLRNLYRGGENRVQRVWALMRRIGRRVAQYNPVSVARTNVAHHYDLSDTLYDLFLDGDRQYSCAYYLSPDDTLEHAQEQKKRHLAAKLLLQPGQHVLDIGSGWGGLALYLARIADVKVTGVTLSAEQHKYSQGCAEEAGLANRVQFRLQDYRHEEGRYDRI